MPAPVEILRELPDSPAGAKQVLVQAAGRRFVVSTAWRGRVKPVPETLVFPWDDARQDYDVSEEVAGGQGRTRDDAIAELAEMFPAAAPAPAAARRAMAVADGLSLLSESVALAESPSPAPLKCGRCGRDLAAFPADHAEGFVIQGRTVVVDGCPDCAPAQPE